MNMALNLGNGGVAVVTGAAGGLGLGLARAAANRGMQVVVTDVDEARLTDAAADLTDQGGKAVGLVVDVTDANAMSDLAEFVAAEFGRVDLVCNNAGMTLVRPIHELTGEDWRRVIDLNLYGVVNGVTAFLPMMMDQGSGHLNATASVNAFKGDLFQAPYNASKAAVPAMMESVLMDLRELGSAVTASVLCPGPIATDIMRRAIGDDEATREEVHGLLNQGMHPDVAGDITISAIEEGRFWIFTHPILYDTIRSKNNNMMRDGSLQADLEWPWEEILTGSETGSL
jgi:NAD(P)-dependent dehydrogenase (short-subunit alcohol dehydrogenase family)